MAHRILAVAALACTLAPPLAPAGCTIVAGPWEDRSAIAACDDGSRIAYDGDGKSERDPRTGTIVQTGEPGWYAIN